MSVNGTEFDEEVEVDKEKETETFHVPNISPDKASGYVIYDFKKVREQNNILAMAQPHRHGIRMAGHRTDGLLNYLLIITS